MDVRVYYALSMENLWYQGYSGGISGTRSILGVSLVPGPFWGYLWYKVPFWGEGHVQGDGYLQGVGMFWGVGMSRSGEDLGYTKYGQHAGGTYATGMLSCWFMGAHRMTDRHMQKHNIPQIS